MTTAPTPPLDLDGIRKRAADATPGPWKSVPVLLAGHNETSSWGESEGRLIDGPPQTVETFTLSARWFSRKQDGDFIAACREDVPALLSALSEQAATIGRLTGERDDARTYRVNWELYLSKAEIERSAAKTRITAAEATAATALERVREVEQTLLQDDALFSSVYQALVSAYGKLDADLGHGPTLNKICDARFEIEKRTKARAALAPPAKPRHDEGSQP